MLGLGFMLMGEHSGALTRRLEARLDEVRPGLPAGVTVEPVYNRTYLVDEVLRTVRTSLLEGAGLVVALTIPLSMLFAFGLMLPAGVVGSLMSLGALDFGLVVDSSVIVVENAERQLALARNRGRRVIDVVREAAVEVRKPTLFGELIIAAVYLPILALEGVEGKLFRP